MSAGELAYVALGSNLHQPERQVEWALTELDQIAHTRLLAWSSLYRTAPVDVPFPQPDYINAVALLRTELTADALLAAMQAIEARHGARDDYRNAPRALDLDLLLLGGVVRGGDALTLPHPRLHRRAFVLAPLVEISPELVIPGLGPARDLLQALANDPGQRVARYRPARPAQQRSA
jgi:2-amino-4-hydroxy-6-hydroxymethyldihydropteridine diphosphokinase